MTKATRDEKTGKWAVTVRKPDGSERVFHVDHVVFALGLGGGAPKIPKIPGQVSTEFVYLNISLSVQHSDKVLAAGRVPRSGPSFYRPSFGERPHWKEGLHHWSVHVWCVSQFGPRYYDLI